MGMEDLGLENETEWTSFSPCLFVSAYEPFLADGRLKGGSRVGRPGQTKCKRYYIPPIYVVPLL